MSDGARGVGGHRGAEIRALRAKLDEAQQNAPTPAEVAALGAIRATAAALRAESATEVAHQG